MIWRIVAAIMLGCSACQHVAPYQRERLAARSMQESQYAGAAEMHVRSVQEGATGGELQAATGCGCN